MDYWQDFIGAPSTARPWRGFYDAALPDGRVLRLPLRDLGETAIAGLIINQASFAVCDGLTGLLAAAIAPLRPEVVVALPTLGHIVGSAVARALGHANWVALGTSRKLWYEEALSVPLTSITSPGTGRRLWLDPRSLARLQGRRVLLIDDVISTGASMRAALDLLERAGVAPIAAGVVMAQTGRWRADWPSGLPLIAGFATPLFHRAGDGWAVADV